MRGVSPRDPLFFLLDSTQMNREINYDQCYQTLQLKPGASLAEIKQRYRELAQRYHPDKVPPAQREHATLQFQRINAAKEALESYWEERRSAPPSALHQRFQDASAVAKKISVRGQKPTGVRAQNRHVRRNANRTILLKRDPNRRHGNDGCHDRARQYRSSTAS